MEDKIKALIIDDNTDNLDMLEFLLTKNNYLVKCAVNGKEALETLHNEDFGLIISDILMPVMDGFQLCKECKKDEKLKNIPFVFYTATYVDSKDEEFALSLGAQKFVRKPQEPDVFLEIINDVIEKFKKNELDTSSVPIEQDEKEILKLYSERLVAKLEKKNLDLQKEIKAHKKTLKELLIAKEKAEESDRLKTAFLTNMSHEIRTPMNGIMGFTNLLKSPNLSEESLEKYINVIQMSSKRLLSLMTDLINISRIETGQTTLNITEFHVNEIISQLHSYFVAEIERKGLQMHIDCNPWESSIQINSDRDKIETVLINLIRNAIKYTQKGSIHIGCRQLNGKLEFKIEDTGLGIPTERLDAIFERFVQADIEDSMAFQGAGIGLSIAKSYAEMVGGDIKVESEEGKGSIFYFTLPLIFSRVKEQNNNIKQIISDKNDLKRFKVLIAEDDEYSDMYLTVLLQDIANEILHAKTGKEAVELCMKHKDVNVILLDIKMPEMDGYMALKKIREFNTEAIIIAQTAYGVIGDREELIKLGCNDYIMKPINEEELGKIIERHVYN